jgi:hypothetical protein
MLEHVNARGHPVEIMLRVPHERLRFFLEPISQLFFEQSPQSRCPSNIAVPLDSPAHGPNLLEVTSKLCRLADVTMTYCLVCLW